MNEGGEGGVGLFVRRGYVGEIISNRMCNTNNIVSFNQNKDNRETEMLTDLQLAGWLDGVWSWKGLEPVVAAAWACWWGEAS